MLFIYILVLLFLVSLGLSISSFVISNKHLNAKRGPTGPQGSQGEPGADGKCPLTCKNMPWTQMLVTPIVNLKGNTPPSTPPSTLFGTVIFFKKVDKYKRYNIFLSLPILSKTSFTPIIFNVMDMIQKEKEEYMGSQDIRFHLKIGTNQYYYPNIIPDQNGYIYVKTDDSNFKKLINSKQIEFDLPFVMYQEA